MKYHFIGLGGIGMSALARILLQKGFQVQGSDSMGSLLLEQLQEEGAKVQIGHSAEMIEAVQTVVYSSGIKEDNVEYLVAKKKNLPMLHRSDLLNDLMEGKKTILVTGTHGKTTTSALLAHVLTASGFDPSFVVGGIVRSLNTNARAGSSDYFIAEADESDGSFLKSDATYGIITNLENDHLDFWGSERVLDLAFQQFINQTKLLFWCADAPRLSKLKTKGISYGFSDAADQKIEHFRQTPQGIIFDLGPYKGIELALLGKHNALNGSAVFLLAKELQIPEEKIREAFRSFLGAARRLEFKGEKCKVQLYDDYGHHPNEIRATIAALREAVREKRLVVVFQPHRYTRVRDLFEEFIGCFDEADELFLTDIYSAGEAQLPGITSAALYTRLRQRYGAKVHFVPRTHLESGVAALLKAHDVILTIGAGDVTKTGLPILELFASQNPKMRVGVLFGGTSAEHPVSIMSAKNIAGALNPALYDTLLFKITKEGQWGIGFDYETKRGESHLCAEILKELLKCDVCIPVFHGPQGEDGMMAALLDAFQIPYVGCDYRTGSISMQKIWTKQIAIHHNIPVAPYLALKAVEYQKEPKKRIDEIESTFAYPIWVKPTHLGSSIGVRKAQDQKELKESIEYALEYDDLLIIEKHIDGRQIEFGILGNEYIQKALPAEIINKGEFVAYDKKYGAGAMEIRVPAEISEAEKLIGLELAEKVYLALGCTGLARVDFFLDNRGVYWLNEINPFPGFTDTSAYPKMWLKSGKTLEELGDEMIVLALHRGRRLSRVRGKS